MSYRIISLPIAVIVTAMVTPEVKAGGTAPLRIKNGTAQEVFFCVDNTGRGAPNDKPMKDGRPGTLLKPGAAIQVPDTNIGDAPTIRIYDRDGNEIHSKKLPLIPFIGEKWEQKWNGEKLTEDKD